MVMPENLPVSSVRPSQTFKDDHPSPVLAMMESPVLLRARSSAGVSVINGVYIFLASYEGTMYNTI